MKIKVSGTFNATTKGLRCFALPGGSHRSGAKVDGSSCSRLMAHGSRQKQKVSGTFICQAASSRRRGSSSRRGVVLVLTLMVLIVMATITYQLTIKLADRRRAEEYLIYYQGARYACDSALKYATLTTQLTDAKYADRTEAPDFSDIFRMTDDQLNEVLQAWADRLNDPNEAMDAESGQTDAGEGAGDIMSLLANLFPDDDSNAWSGFSTLFAAEGPADANQLVIPGPYGPPWPLVTDPVEFEIGSAKVTITIEDENAKLPLIWMINTDQQLAPVTAEALRIFCGWYGVDEDSLAEFRQKLDDAAQIRAFSPDLSPAAVTVAAQTPGDTASRAAPRTSRTARMAASAQASAAAASQPQRLYTDYRKIMASSLVDADWLTVPVIEGRARLEYPLKYLAVWGSTQVNINSAPRHVLEAAFAFGGDGDRIADAIILQRQEKPFENLEDLRKRNIAFGLQIQKSEKYITTSSNFFTIRITAANGPARCTATAAVIKSGNGTTKIAAVFE